MRGEVKKIVIFGGVENQWGSYVLKMLISIPWVQNPFADGQAVERTR